MLLDIHEPGQTPVPHAQKRAIGIDLGTTNSVAASVREDAPAVLADGGSRLIPSVVAYGEDGSVLVGQAALEKADDPAYHLVASIKRLMGRGPDDLKAVAGTLPYRISAGEGGMVRLEIAGKTLSPVEISAEILRTVKARAAEALGEDITDAVITVPAYFDDAARAATKDAARLAGLDVLRLVNEPTAAALAYGLDQGAEGVYAVYDLGGGTFDISILRLQKGVFQVLATGGDAALGGDDFDHLIAEDFAEQAGLAEGSLSAAAAKALLRTARKAKEALTGQPEGAWTITVQDKPVTVSLDRERLNRLLAPLIGRTIGICDQVLEDADLTQEEIQGVVLVGGSTRVPAVREAVAARFGREPLANIDPDEVVALGAAEQAHALTAGSDTLLLDVVPLSLGLETMGGLTEKIISRNTPIPVAQAQEFTTYQDGQTGMVIHVVQGEREMVDENRSLARFELTGIPAMTAGAARIRVTFTVDADGMLTVSAREQSTGVESEVAVKPSYGLAEGEIERMLNESMEHARDDVTRRLLTESRVEANRMALATRSALERDGDLLSADDRAAIEAALAELETAAKGDDRDAIDAAVTALDRATQAFAQARMDRGFAAALSGLSLDAVSDRFSVDRKE